ncbi:MAG: hypothetical protein M1347_02880 [Chloroflexi bacterium]|nr:hypothetical protein [Chloroflexota bacterium]
MVHYKGRIAEVLLEEYQNASARLYCPSEAVPRPGQYLQAHGPDNPMEVVPTSLFFAGENEESKGATSLPVAGQLPESWQPGTELLLRGPLGRGFELSKRARRIALVALDGNPSRLLPLVSDGLRQGAEITLFSEEASNGLPIAVEQQNLKELHKGLKWADYLAVDISVENLERLEPIFAKRLPAALAAEILVAAPMPCGGMAKCGVCTVRTRSGPRLACEDGPVFEMRDLLLDRSFNIGTLNW